MAVVRGLVAVSVGGLLCAIPLGAQQVATGTITGRVVDSTSQQPLANVTVAVPGTQRGALTAADGRFTITAVPAGTQQVRAQRIGYGSKQQQVTVTGGASVTVTFSLAATASALTEVVVVGYGAQRREAITGSVATVNAEEANVGVIANANQLLTARVAGVNVVTNNGEPGGGAQVRIRGGTSISASNDPLYVIDGVPIQNEAISPQGIGIGGGAALARSPLNTLNPADIASITVLKDASATAIYGSRGANGVVLIETKKGTAGTSQVEYEGFVAANTPTRTYDVLTGNEYRSFIGSLNQRYTTAKASATPRDTVFGLNATSNPTLGNFNTNWSDEILRTSLNQNHNLAFAGGSQATQYRAALNFFDQQGLVLNNGLQRYQGRLNAQSQALEGKLRLGLNLTASRVNNRFLPFENTGGFEGGVFTNVAIFNPTQPVTVFDTAASATQFYEIGRGPLSVRNPVALTRQINDRSAENRTLGNVTASYSFLPSLVGQMTLGIDQANALRQIYFPIASPVGAQTSGRARQEERSLSNVNYQSLLTFTPTIGGTQELEVVGGYEFTQFDNRGFRSDVRGFASDATGSENLGAGTQAQSLPDSSGRVQSRLVSFFGRANYGFRNKYFLTGVLRYDGSTRLAPGNQWSLFPAISASYRLSEEGFMQNSPFSNLTIRAGYGLQGNQAVDPYATQVLVRADNGARYPFGNNVQTGFVAARNENRDLKWETSAQANIGLDYGFLDNRISGLIDLYQKDTRDLLLEVAVAQPAFVSTRFENIGSIRNRGLEATVNADLVTRPASSFTAGLVFSVERNTVQSIGRPFILTGSVSGQGQTGRFAQRIIPGQPLGTFFGPQFVRINEEGRQLFACSRSGQGNADCVNGVTTSPRGDDDRIIGNANPDFSLGLTSRATFRKFDASWLWRAEAGRDVFNNTTLIYSSKANVLQGRNLLRSAVDDGTAVDESAKFSSRFIEDGSFVRLQNVTLGYNFTLPGFAGRGAATRFYVSGDNLLLFTPYSGLDPEVFVNAGVASRGIDYLTYPRARTFTTGVRVQF
jgi:iron complex outermembrane receptor protein